MLDHMELIFWKKCPACGYSELHTKNLSEKMKEIASKNPLAPRNKVIDIVTEEQP